MTLSTFDDYLAGVLKQIKISHQILERLKDKSGDLEIIKKELAKINGMLHVVIRKLESSNNHSDKYVELSIAAKFYLENYYFDREIETMAKLYSEDSNRLKNIRHSILKALSDKKLIKKVESIIENS